MTLGQLLSLISISAVPIGFIHQIWSSKSAREELFGAKKTQLYGLMTFEIKEEEKKMSFEKRSEMIFDIQLIE